MQATGSKPTTTRETENWNTGYFCGINGFPRMPPHDEPRGCRDAWLAGWDKSQEPSLSKPLHQTTELRLILAMAPSFQGGHCKTGGAVADYLGLPFPLTTSNLERKAKACGFDPYDLWPWLKQIKERDQRAGTVSSD